MQAQKMKQGFQKYEGNGVRYEEGHFTKREYCPIILKLSN